MMNRSQGIALVEVIITLLLVALFLTTSYTMLARIANLTLDVVDPMPVYTLLATKLDAIKRDINDSLIFEVDGNQIHYVLKNGQQGTYDFSQFSQWFSPEYQASATVNLIQNNTAVVTWQFTTPRDLKLYGTTVLKKATQAVPVPKEIVSTSGGVLINLYNPAVGIGTASSTSAQVSARYADATTSTVTASLINSINVGEQNAYYSVFVSTATKPVGRSSMVEHQAVDLGVRVRLPSPTPIFLSML